MSQPSVLNLSPEITMPDTLTTDLDLTGLNGAIAGKTKAATWVRDTARRHGVTFAETPVDAFAAAVSRLSDAGVQLDQTEQLLLALARAGIVTDAQRFALHAAYLRQSRT